MTSRRRRGHSEVDAQRSFGNLHVQVKYCSEQEYLIKFNSIGIYTRHYTLIIQAIELVTSSIIFNYFSQLQ